MGASTSIAAVIPQGEKFHAHRRIWALCAEMYATVPPETRAFFEAMGYEVGDGEDATADPMGHVRHLGMLGFDPYKPPLYKVDDSCGYTADVCLAELPEGTTHLRVAIGW